MKRDSIRRTFAAHCAMLGYAPGDVGWSRGRLHLLTDAAAPLTARKSDGLPAGATITIAAPCGMRRADLIEALRVIPRVGEPRRVAAKPQWRDPQQLSWLPSST